MIPNDELNDYVPCDSATIIRKDNHIYNIVKTLRERESDIIGHGSLSKKGMTGTMKESVS